MSFGAWDGRQWDDIERDDAVEFRRWAERWTELAPPKGETVTELTTRARAFLEDLRDAHADSNETVLVVSHAGWIRAALSVLLEEPAAAILARRIDYAHATILRVDSATIELLAENTATIA